MSTALRQRLRLRYKKDDVLMYISHRDLLRFVLRLLRRAEVPAALSGGFSPKPRVSFGPALPLGVSAENELLDIELADGVLWDGGAVLDAARRLAEAASPRDFLAALAVLAPGAPGIANLAAAARYHLQVQGNAEAAIPCLTEGSLVHCGRSGATRDLREAILSHRLGGKVLEVDGRVGGGANLNVLDLAQCLTSLTGLAISRCHRFGLLDAQGRLL